MPSQYAGGTEERSSVRRAEQPPEPSERDPRALYYTEDTPVRSKAMLDEVSKGNDPARNALLQSAQEGQISRSVQRFIQRTAAPSTTSTTSVSAPTSGPDSAPTSTSGASQEQTTSAVSTPVTDIPATPDLPNTSATQETEVSTAATRDFEMLPDPAAAAGSSPSTPADPQQDPAAALELDTQQKVQAMQRTQDALTPERVSEVLTNVRLGPLPEDPPDLKPSLNETEAEEGASPGGAQGGPQKETPSDIIDAVLASPRIIDTIKNLKKQAEEQISSHWAQLVSGERSRIISAGVVVGIPTFAGLADLSNLNGQVLPVPGADWLKIEVSVDPEGNDLMLGLHVDLGLLLPDSLGQKGAGKPRTPSAAPAEPPPGGDNTDKSDNN